MPPAAKPVVALAILLTIGAAGCIDPIDLGVGESERRLVVEALVTEGPGPHRVVLSRSGSFTQGIDALRPRERGAVVVVEIGDGTEVALEELASPTRYESAPGELVGVVGQRYALRVELQDGTVYRSDPITMRPAPPVHEVRAELFEGSRLEGDVVVSDPQVHVRVDAGRLPGQPTFYRWTWSGTYSRQACYVSNGLEFCDRCYVDARGTSLVEIADDGLASGSVLADQQAASFSISEHGPKFVPALFVTIEQQALTPEAFHFWSLIRDTRDNVGSLFDPPAEAILGNMINVENPNDRALGYFTVAGAAHADTCVRRDDFDDFPSFPATQPVAGRCGVTVAGSVTPPPGFEQACARD